MSYLEPIQQTDTSLQFHPQNYSGHLGTHIHDVCVAAIDDNAGIWMSRLDEEAFEEAHINALGIDLPNRLLSARLKRKAHYSAGRYLAKLALRSKTAKPFNDAATTGRAPVWPLGWFGSISHCTGIAACMISAKIARAGVDVENVLTPTRAASIVGRVISDSERATFDALNLPLELKTTMAFSAKEAMYKAIYSEVQAPMTFSDGRLVSINETEVVLELVRNLAPNLKQGDHIHARCDIVWGKVLTWMYAPLPPSGSVP